jgi:hypothetical protein
MTETHMEQLHEPRSLTCYCLPLGINATTSPIELAGYNKAKSTPLLPKRPRHRPPFPPNPATPPDSNRRRVTLPQRRPRETTPRRARREGRKPHLRPPHPSLSPAPRPKGELLRAGRRAPGGGEVRRAIQALTCGSEHGCEPIRK